jgi:hypothetical protein
MHSYTTAILLKFLLLMSIEAYVCDDDASCARTYVRTNELICTYLIRHAHMEIDVQASMSTQTASYIKVELADHTHETFLVTGCTAEEQKFSFSSLSRHVPWHP